MTTCTPTMLVYSKHKNGFVAVKKLKVYHDDNPHKLLKPLRADGVDRSYFCRVSKVMVMLDDQAK